MDSFYKDKYFKYGEKKFLIAFAILFSVVVNFIANFTIVVFFRGEISVLRIIIYTLTYLVIGWIAGKAKIKKIKEELD
ncbi:MAG: hypothetical protein JXQ26_02665 [Tissierellales bacterium]|nr:hypothetical protein [Tissierellales bacterium]